MAYRLEISELAESQIDDCIGYIVNVLKNPPAARSILTDIEKAYDKLENTPESFALCNDPSLASKGYRKLRPEKHDYLLIYRADENIVLVAGFFHMLEYYGKKL